jgi:hypothetical protein
MRLPFHIRQDLLLIQSNRGHEIPGRPNYSLPPVYFSQPRKLFPQPTCRVLLHSPNHRAHPILRRNHDQHVNMVNLHIELNDLTPLKTPYYLREKSSQITSHTRIQDTAAIFRNPNNVVLRSVNSMARQTGFHALNIPYTAAFAFTHGQSPWNSALRAY